MNSFSDPSRLFFLSGEGEMATLIRNYDWSATSIGTPDTWSASLRSTLSIVLNSAFPMFLFWGSDLLCFYNDAYRPSLGMNGKHPAIGKKAADIWSEAWDFMGPLVERVMKSGKPGWFEDQYIPFYRNGKVEDIYWTFSYSAAYDDDGAVGGLLITCMETTEKVRLREKLTLSEKRFETLVHDAPVGIAVIMGDQLIVELANDAYSEITGRTKDELIGKPFFESVPEAEPYFGYILETVVKTGEPYYMYEHPYFVIVDGEERHGFLNMIYQPYREENNVVSGIMVLCQDVTGQMADRHQVEKTEQRMRAMVENAPFPIGVYTGREMRIELANRAMMEVWGKGSDVIGKLYPDIMSGLHNEEVFEQITNVLETGIPYHGRNKRFDLMVGGRLQPYYFNYSLTPLYDNEGAIYGVMNTAAETTDLNLAKLQVEEVVKERTRELATANEHLRSSNAELAQFAHIASHDLQEPLRKISIFSEMLGNKAGDKLDMKSKEYLSKIHLSANRMHTLIRDILNYSELIRDSEVFSEVDLNDIFEQTIVDYELLIEQKQATVTAVNLPVIEAIPLQLSQLFGNLLGNSLKYSHPDRRPEITITGSVPFEEEIRQWGLDPTPDYCKLIFSDNGIGIQAIHTEQIFHIFQRLHSKNEYAGTGIGLAMCRKIAHNHYGEIHADGSSENGGVFTVILPVKRQIHDK